MENKIGKLRDRALFASIFAALGFVSVATESLAEVKNSSYERSRETWTQLNAYSPASGYHSQGSFGTHIGIGAIAPNQTAASSDDAAQSELQQPKPRLFLEKGTPWPVDFGLSYSKLEGKNSLQAGAHIQWTVFEDFQMPSVALRASRSMLRNYHELKELTTDSVELGVSYGLFRYVILSFGISQQWDKGTTQAREQFFSLTEAELPNWNSRRTAYSWGINICPFTPFVQIGVEQSYWNNETRASIAKISFLL